MVFAQIWSHGPLPSLNSHSFMSTQIYKNKTITKDYHAKLLPASNKNSPIQVVLSEDRL